MHFTYLGRRATKINRLDSLLETGRLKWIFADTFRPRKLKIDHLHNTFRPILFQETPIRYYKNAGNLPRQDGTATRRSTRSGTVEVVMDDILIHGEMRAKHDEHYENVL